MLLSNILKNINYISLHNYNKDIEVRNISTNSKLINKNSIFIIDTKKNIKKIYITEAIKRGAKLIISKKIIKNIKIPQLIVTNLDSVMKQFLNKFKKYPPNNIVGITGTNGKTSVVSIISNIIFLCKYNVLTSGTLGFYKNLKKINDTILTTPEKEDLYQFAYSSSPYYPEFIFEASSHGIYQNRIKDLPINIAALTNISHDHLDYHKTLINYKKTKFKLFTKFLLKKGVAILNDNIKGIDKLKKKLFKKEIKVISYGKNTSDINCNILDNKKIRVKIYKKYHLIRYNITSKFELENLSCSIACCLEIGVNINKMKKIFHKIKKIDGRMELVGCLYNGSKIYVDYAHTPDALKNVLYSNLYDKKKPDLVFGCGGDRDKSKRIKMGRIANIYSNKIYITDDNPRKEDPKIIRKNILSACKKGIEVADRKQAIKKAIYNLESNSTLIIAGKGHEKKQIFSNKVVPFNDVKIAKFFISKINKDA